MAVPFLVETVTTALPALRGTSPQGSGVLPPVQSLSRGWFWVLSRVPFWECRMHQHSCSASEGARWLSVTWQEHSQSHWGKADGCCAQLVKGWGAPGSRQIVTEQLQSCAYKYTPTAVGWWAVDTELCLCLLLLPTTSLWWNPAFLHKEFTDSKAVLLPGRCLLAAGSSRQ